jgi:hypothetical protein
MPTAALPPITLPRKLGGAARTASPASAVPAGSRLTKDNVNPSNIPLSQYRQTRSSPDLMRKLAAGDPLASTALLNLLSLADSGFKVQAFSTFSQEFSPEGMRAAEAVISSLDSGWDSSKGYSQKRSMASTIETALREVSLTGGVVAELILNSSRLPDRIAIADYSEIYWVSDGKGGATPVQKPKTGEERPLDFPNIFIGESVKSAAERYASPMMVSGAQALWQYTSYFEDAWRTMRKAGEPRLTASLNYEQIVRASPPEIQNDPDKLAEFLESARSQIETLLSGLNPEDSLVVFDMVTLDKIDSGSEKRDFAQLLETMAGIAASGLKSSPTIMGLTSSGGSQNTASVAAVLATKSARRLQVPVEEVLSKALTLAVRMLGIDCYVEFRFRPIELRPVSELSAFRAMDQARVLELLSWGFVTMSEAQSMMDLGSLPDGVKDLSGTGFYKAPAVATSPAGFGVIGQNVGQPGNTSAGGADQAQRP